MLRSANERIPVNVFQSVLTFSGGPRGLSVDIAETVEAHLASLPSATRGAVAGGQARCFTVGRSGGLRPVLLVTANGPAGLATIARAVWSMLAGDLIDLDKAPPIPDDLARRILEGELARLGRPVDVSGYSAPPPIHVVDIQDGSDDLILLVGNEAKRYTVTDPDGAWGIIGGSVKGMGWTINPDIPLHAPMMLIFDQYGAPVPYNPETKAAVEVQP